MTKVSFKFLINGYDSFHCCVNTLASALVLSRDYSKLNCLRWCDLQLQQVSEVWWTDWFGDRPVNVFDHFLLIDTLVQT